MYIILVLLHVSFFILSKATILKQSVNYMCIIKDNSYKRNSNKRTRAEKYANYLLCWLLSINVAFVTQSEVYYVTELNKIYKN